VAPMGYAELLEQVKVRVRTSRVQAARAVNTELVGLYWQIGRLILDRHVESEGWGSKVIGRLAADLRAEFPGMRGLSQRSLVYMRTFAGAFAAPIAQQPAAQLAWGHIMVLLDKVTEPEARQWYAAQTVESRLWSRARDAGTRDVGELEGGIGPTRQATVETGPELAESRRVRCTLPIATVVIHHASQRQAVGVLSGPRLEESPRHAERTSKVGKTTAARLADYQARYHQLAERITEIGFVQAGSITLRYTRCGTPTCRCRADPPQRHGPYYQWTAKVEGKTVTRRLSQTEADLYQEWIDNDRQLRALITQMRQIAAKATALIPKKPHPNDEPEV